MKTLSKICAIFVVISAILSIASSLSCYQCSTEKDGNKCRYDLRPSDTQYITDNCEYCIKHYYDDTHEIERKCLKKNSSGWSYRSGCVYKYNDGNEYDDCACSDDLCNGARKETARLFGLFSVCLSVSVLALFV